MNNPTLQDHVIAVFDEWRNSEPSEGISHQDLGFRAWDRVPATARAQALGEAVTAFVDHVMSERQAIEDAKNGFDLREQIVRNEYSYSGVLGDGTGMSTEDLELSADDVIARIPADEVVTALKQAIVLATPKVLFEEAERVNAREVLNPADRLAEIARMADKVIEVEPDPGIVMDPHVCHCCHYTGHKVFPVTHRPWVCSCSRETRPSQDDPCRESTESWVCSACVTTMRGLLKGMPEGMSVTEYTKRLVNDQQL